MAQHKVTTKTMLRCALGVAVTATVLVTAPACASEKPAESALKGLLALEPGKIEGNKLSGTWFKMVQPGGNPQEGPFMPNANSPVPQGAATLLSPGADGGLVLGDYQGEPDPAFDEATGYSLAARVTQPTKFFNIEFGISTNKIDPQTQRELSAPTATVSGDTISADLSAWAASWNRQEFNQGAPKPKAKEQAQIPGEARAKQVWEFVAGRWVGHDSVDGESPKATGTYDKGTKKFTLDWTSLIVGGPFNSFTGVWHLEGVVKDR
ncbi:hypothetical protein BKG76_05930 [Mycobacteroides franklinii]|uniref:Uncharacterized protein n=1 Tax=Mycobacteroides franklinii TaxID=948102 RepID=A0A1S1LE45_9MYCO|nr:hypothetical protein [Mycobacteroides franklinii]OHU31211.1 hypothetical protein BKG76_05930 [Mycobacteroides franklinii]